MIVSMLIAIVIIVILTFFKKRRYLRNLPLALLTLFLLSLAHQE